MSILKLSTMWEFAAIRKYVINQMSECPMDLAEKIAIARDYHITEWLLPSLNDYARLGRPISEEDVNVIGLDYLLKIVAARQKGIKLCYSKGTIWCHRCRYYRNYYGDVDFYFKRNGEHLLGDAFRDEMDSMRRVWSLDRAFSADGSRIYVKTSAPWTDNRVSDPEPIEPEPATSYEVIEPITESPELSLPAVLVTPAKVEVNEPTTLTRNSRWRMMLQRIFSPVFRKNQGSSTP
jgi:hypothetical protein